MPEGDGNSWAEQEAAFFGTAVSPPPPAATANGSSINRKQNGRDAHAAPTRPRRRDERSSGRASQLAGVGPTLVRMMPAVPSALGGGGGSSSGSSAARPQPRTQSRPPQRTDRGGGASSSVVDWFDRTADSASALLSSLQQSPPSLLTPRPRRSCMCVHCGDPSPSRYKYHPFFPSSLVCATHPPDSIRRCCACNRYEPSPSAGLEPFADLDEGGNTLNGSERRVICPACLRTAVLSSSDAAPLWEDVIRFLRHTLSLEVWAGMESIPILMVEPGALNDPAIAGNRDVAHTRGLCLSESRTWSFGQGDALLRRLGLTDTSREVSVTAILCLRALPADLAGSILAHEAIHAWFRLHPPVGNGVDQGEALPPLVEEGCCQLVAHLYLSDEHRRGLRNNGNGGDGEEPSDERLRQYFRSSIESDTSEIYGEGFRRAAVAYADMGLEPLLEYVVLHHMFP